MVTILKSLLIATLFLITPVSEAANDSSASKWNELILYKSLLQKEVTELKKIPAGFKAPYEVEIKLKTRSMVLLETVLKIKAGIIKAKGGIPAEFKMNPYKNKFETQWNQVISKLETLPKINCTVNASEICDALKAQDLDQVKLAYQSAGKKDPLSKVISLSLDNNWTEALRSVYSLSETDPVHKLTYDIIQRIYSFKHQGSGEVAIKGI